MKVSLSVKDRIIVLNMLRQAQGDIVLLKVIKKTIDQVGFDPDEIKHYGFVFDPETGQTNWEDDGEKKEIEMDDAVFRTISEQVRKMNKEGKLGLDYISIYDEFVGE